MAVIDQEKTSLVEYGFRLPSAYDNRPLKFEEFEKKTKSSSICKCNTSCIMN